MILIVVLMFASCGSESTTRTYYVDSNTSIPEKVPEIPIDDNTTEPPVIEPAEGMAVIVTDYGVSYIFNGSGDVTLIVGDGQIGDSYEYTYSDINNSADTTTDTTTAIDWDERSIWYQNAETSCCMTCDDNSTCGHALTIDQMIDLYPEVKEAHYCNPIFSGDPLCYTDLSGS